MTLHADLPERPAPGDAYVTTIDVAHRRHLVVKCEALHVSEEVNIAPLWLLPAGRRLITCADREHTARAVNAPGVETEEGGFVHVATLVVPVVPGAIGARLRLGPLYGPVSAWASAG